MVAGESDLVSIADVFQQFAQTKLPDSVIEAGAFPGLTQNKSNAAFLVALASDGTEISSSEDPLIERSETPFGKKENKILMNAAFTISNLRKGQELSEREAENLRRLLLALNRLGEYHFLKAQRSEQAFYETDKRLEILRRTERVLERQGVEGQAKIHGLEHTIKYASCVNADGTIDIARAAGVYKYRQEWQAMLARDADPAQLFVSLSVSNLYSKITGLYEDMEKNAKAVRTIREIALQLQEVYQNLGWPVTAEKLVGELKLFPCCA